MLRVVGGECGYECDGLGSTVFNFIVSQRNSQSGMKMKNSQIVVNGHHGTADAYIVMTVWVNGR